MSEETIGRALRTRRAQLGLDQRDAATRIGMSRTTYSSYERDTQRPSVDVLPAIAGFLEVSLDEVLALFGASAIAAARTALGRLNLSASPVASEMSDVGATSSASATSDESAGVYATENVGIDDSDTVDSSPYRPAVSINTTDEPHVKAQNDKEDKEKGKKKKKKKGKREKLVDPAFATHV